MSHLHSPTTVGYLDMEETGSFSRFSFTLMRLPNDRVGGRSAATEATAPDVVELRPPKSSRKIDRCALKPCKEERERRIFRENTAIRHDSVFALYSIAGSATGMTTKNIAHTRGSC